MLTPFELIATYDAEKYGGDPSLLLLRYYGLRGYADRFPDLNYTQLSERWPDVSYSTTRRWDGETTPKPVQAIETAEELGLFDADTNTDLGGHLCLLVAGIYACGNVDGDTYHPRWYPTSDLTREWIETALLATGLDHTAEYEEDDRDAAIAPASRATLLGRSLVVLGSPHGAKSDARGIARS
jgi:hypothetical protein